MWQDGYSHIPARMGSKKKTAPAPITITITEEKGWKLCEVQVEGEGDEIAINLSFLIYRIGRPKWVSRHIKGKRQKKF